MTQLGVGAGPDFIIPTGTSVSNEVLVTETTGDAVSVLFHASSIGQALTVQGNRASRDGEPGDNWDDIVGVTIADNTITPIEGWKLAAARLRIKAAGNVSGDKTVYTTKQFYY